MDLRRRASKFPIKNIRGQSELACYIGLRDKLHAVEVARRLRRGRRARARRKVTGRSRRFTG